jgi:hypothetical protein
MQPEARSCIHSLLQTVKELKDTEFIDVLGRMRVILSNCPVRAARGKNTAPFNPG